MRVLLLTDADVFAGTERHMLSLAQALPAAGVQPMLGCPVVSVLAEAARTQGIAHLSVEKGGAVDHAAIRAVAKALREGRCDLVHAHNGRTALIGALARQLAGRGALVITQHFIEPARLRRRQPMRAVALTLHRWVSGQAGRLIGVSEVVCDRMRARHDAPADRIVTIPNGIDEPTPNPDATTTRHALGISAEQHLIVCLARLEPEKNLATLIEAMAHIAAKHSTAHCVIAGEGSQRSQLESLIAARNLNDRVRLLGFRADAAALLNAADEVALPSTNESFGLALTEAMALRRPVVAINAGGPKEVVVHGETGLLVPPRDSAAFAAALDQLLSDAALRQRFGEAGRQRYEQRFTAAAMAQATAAAYRAALQDSENTHKGTEKKLKPQINADARR